MKQVDVIQDNNKVYAYIVRPKVDSTGVNFVTTDESSFQLAVSQYESDQKVRAHIHLPQTRAVHDTQECLFIVSGEARVDVYNDDKQLISQNILHEGDVVLFVSGGHGIAFNKTTRIVEVKQGPYQGQGKDKAFIE